MKIYKPYFWRKKKHFFVFLLLPLSILVNIFIFLKKKIVKTKNFKIPIICVGNIYIGGTGKTPASILICKELERMSLKPALIRKYYKNHNMNSSFVGHPFFDEWKPTSKKILRKKLGLDTSNPVLTLYPGSRQDEIKMRMQLCLT